MSKKNILRVTLIILIISCNEPKKELPEELKWTQGGKLHKAIVTDWKAATDQNKLATCADFVCNIKADKGEAFTSNIEMKADAFYLKTCIDEATKGDYVDNNKIAEIAAMCLVLKGSE